MIRHKFQRVFNLGFILCIFTAAFSAVTFDSSFECGNGTSFTSVGTNEYNFEIEPDTNSTDRQWFYFAVSGANGTPLTFHLQNINQTNVPSHWSTARPVASPDGGQTWDHISGATSNTSSVFTFSHTPTSDTERIAFHFPYTWTHLQERITAWSAHSDVTHSVIGQSFEGRDIHMLRVANAASTPPGGKRGFWIVARQHAAEVTGSWYCEGFMEFLLSDDSIAQSLRDFADIYVVPMCNPDGVVAGNYRNNSQGVNLNRVWNGPSMATSPEILAVTQAIATWEATAPSYDFFADLHSTSGAFPHYAYYAASSIEPPLYTDPPNYYENSVDFLNLLNSYNPAFDNTIGASSSTDQRLSRQHQMFTYGVFALLFEAGYNRINHGPNSGDLMTPVVHKSMGEALARTLHDTFAPPAGVPASIWMMN